MNGEQPKNIRREWNGFIQRLQGAACSQAGYAIISIRLIVGPDGNPVVWTEPQLSKIEPLSSREWMRLILTLPEK